MEDSSLQNRRKEMTELEFLALCGEHLIDPLIALENEALEEALLRRDDKLVVRILQEDF